MLSFMANTNPVDGFTAVLSRPMLAVSPRINVEGFLCRGPYEATAIATFGAESVMALHLASLGAEVDDLQRRVVRESRRLALSLAEYADDLVARPAADGSCPMGDSTARDIAAYAERLRTKRADFYSLAGALATMLNDTHRVRMAGRLPTIIGKAVAAGEDLSTADRFESFRKSASAEAEMVAK